MPAALSPKGQTGHASREVNGYGHSLQDTAVSAGTVAGPRRRRRGRQSSGTPGQVPDRHRSGGGRTAGRMARSPPALALDDRRRVAAGGDGGSGAFGARSGRSGMGRVGPATCSPRVRQAAAARAWMCRCSVRLRRATARWSWPAPLGGRRREGGKAQRSGVRRTRQVCSAVWPRSPSRLGGGACRCTAPRGSRHHGAGLRAGRATSRVRPSPGSPQSAASARCRGVRLPFPATTGARPSHRRRRTSVPSLGSSFPSSLGRLRTVARPCPGRLRPSPSSSPYLHAAHTAPTGLVQAR